jgi:GNAT superfamily N-acetyltransferase
MTKEIRQAEFLTDVEKQKLFGWGDDIFGASSLDLRWRPKDVHFLLYVDRRAVSHIGILKHVVDVDGQPMIVGGVGGVVTVPEEQKRGHARELMQHATRLLKEWRVDAGLLFCLKRMVPYYEAQGWRVVEQPVLIEQPAGEIASPLAVMVLTFGGRRWPDGKVKLNSLPW